MSTIRSIWAREQRGSWDDVEVKPRLSLYQIFDNFTCYKEDEHSMTAAEEGGVVPLPFSCSFSKQSSSQHIVAVANEDGKVHLIDTLKSKSGCVKTWQAHVNAVFDIAWVYGENKLVTGSGDQTAQLWDVETAKCISVFKGHTCSLRSISFKHNHSNVFATGARDGNVMVWDTRTRPMKSGHYKPVNVLHGVHNTLPTAAGPANNRRSSSARNTESVQQSVTTVLFKDENHLYSSGAADGSIKLWDIRRYYTTAKGIPQPKHVYPYVGTATRKHGISSLSLTSCGSLLFSSCTDDNIYMYNTYLDTKDPVSAFSGHTNSTFYVKSCVTRDDEFLVSGSSSHSLFVWDIKHPELAPVKLDGHSGEVTSVACSSSDLGQIVSCSDDNTVRMWRVHDQVSLCKEGYKCGSSARLVNHAPVLMTSLNLHDKEETDTTPTRGSRGSATTPSSSRSKKITPVRGRQVLGTPTRRQTSSRATLTPTRSSTTPCRPERSGLRAIVEDEQAPSSSRQDDPAISKILDKTPTSSPLRHSPRHPPAAGEERTPGKISSYFKSNGMLSSEKKRCEESPVRQSPRLNKILLSQSTRTIGALELEKADKLTRKQTKQTNEVRTPVKEQHVSSPRKNPKRKEKLTKTSSDSCSTPTKCRPKQEITSPRKKGSPVKSPVSRVKGPVSPVKSPVSPTKGPASPVKIPRVSVGIQSPGASVSSVGTQSRMSGGVSVATQTLSPLHCTSTCRSCCRNFTPLYSAPKTYTPIPNTTGGGTCTPSTAGTDLTPRSCSSSSIPRPKRIYPPTDIPTTPTKTHILVLKHRSQSPENKENSDVRMRRKFTKTGTPIHRYNCRCTFCVSSATELSELSSSPILDMPCRPRKRLLSHEYSAESCPKKRKSLFSFSKCGSEVELDDVTKSCSPYNGQEIGNKQDSELQENKPPDSQVITVSQWLGGKIEERRTLCDNSQGDHASLLSNGGDHASLLGNGGDHVTAEEECDRSVTGDVGHDHSQCSSLHCIRSYFTKKG